jgi:hypothetical protein
MKTEHITQTEFFYMQECMKTLHVIGLDVRGGLFGFCKIWARNTAHTAWPMAFIIVKDPDTARKYVNIGITLGCATPSYPSTLKEAAEKYAQICNLIEDEDGNTATIKDLDKQIEEATDEAIIWELKREKFRVQMKEKYHDILIDMALEDKVRIRTSRLIPILCIK